jgi:hypothetical protein
LKVRGAVLLFAVASAQLWADAGAPAPPVNAPEILARYVEAIRIQQSHPQSESMEIDIDAKLPRLQKQGRFHALRFITRVGKIFYTSQHFEGDGTIKKEVIARYLQAEKDARADPDGSMSVTPDNYKFKYKEITDYAGQSAYVFQVTPKKKRLGLYKGELWIDKETYLPLREWGVLAKSPSVFVKSVYFVRDYRITDGISVPCRLISDVNTRIAGKAQLTIWYQNVKVGDDQPSTTAAVNGGGL